MTSVRTEHEQNRNDMLSLFDTHTFRVLGHSDDNRNQPEMFSVKFLNLPWANLILTTKALYSHNTMNWWSHAICQIIL